MNINKIYPLFLLSFGISTGLFFTGCDLTMDLPVASPGTGDFSRYMAVGSSFEAGYTSDGLTKYSQETSYPNLLAEQLRTVGIGPFRQPLLPEGNGSGMYKLMSVSTDTCNIITPVLEKTEPDQNWENNIAGTATFHNLGIPNMKTGDLNNSNISILNSYLKRVVTPGMTYFDLMDFAIAEIHPTFFTNWFGLTDAIAYSATGGGYIDNLPVSLFALTDTLLFADNYGLVLDKLQADGATGMVFTIPKILDFPFFTSVSYQAKGPDSCDHKLDVYITATNGVRKATFNPNSLYNDKILLPAGAELGRLDLKQVNGVDTLVPYGLSEYNPLLHDHALDRTEVQNCVLAIQAYNRAIRKAAAERSVPVIDTDEYFNKLKAGTAYNGVPLSTTFISGGFFGLDGIHPSDRGYALLSNFFIQKIDSIYGATIPEMDITKFKGVVFQ